MGHLHLVSNRLPVTLVAKGENGLEYESSVGGLTTGLKSFHEAGNCVWTGWCGWPSDDLSHSEQDAVNRYLRDRACNPVPLTKRDVHLFYEGFSNRTIWPHFHYFPHLTVYDRRLWEAYVDVNRRFCDTLVEVVSDGDTVWVHDYQLLLLPKMLRERKPDVNVGFFLHIPFPSFELFRLLPWRQEILEGILGADLVGFHTYEYARHFFNCLRRILGCEPTLGEFSYDERFIKVDVFPMGIDYDRYAAASESPETKCEIERIRKGLGETKIILSIDRLDYTKGLPARLASVDHFLRKYPEMHGKFVLVLIEVPSRTGVDSYADLKSEVDEKIGSINGRYSSLDWLPIHYLAASQPFETLCALYYLADVALVTPARDGMNLVAKEFVAVSRAWGVLVLSETAGAASELGEAIHVNPNDYDQTAEAIKRALEVPADEQSKALEIMKKRLRRYTVHKWAEEFLGALDKMGGRRIAFKQRLLAGDAEREFVEAYRRASSRLLLLDYDGTMIPFAPTPEAAVPDDELGALLRRLSEDRRNDVVILSGRDRGFLDAHFGSLPIGLSAEHGVWLKPHGRSWERAEYVVDQWKDEIRVLLESYCDRTPGTHLEEKEFALAWHYRRADSDLATQRRAELREDILNFAANLSLSVMEGNKVLEVKNSGISKGSVAARLTGEKQHDFVFAIGDDVTDEDTFLALPESAYTIKVGMTGSRARFNVGDVSAARRLLATLAAEA